MASYSMVLGGALGRAGYDMERFCEAAEEFRDSLAKAESEDADKIPMVLAMGN